MRMLLSAVLFVSLCSAVRAERIQIVGVVASYVTARDTVDIELWLDRPIEPARGEWLWFTGGGPFTVSSGEDGPLFNIVNRTIGSPSAAPLDYFNLQVGRRQGGGIADSSISTTQHIERQQLRNGAMAYGTVFTLPADSINFDAFARNGTFSFKAIAQFNNNGAFGTDVVLGVSTVNSPQATHAPEPSAVALLGVGVVGLLVHLVRRPGFRERRVKRHVG